MEDVGFEQRRSAGFGRQWRSGHTLLLIPLSLIALITIVDILTPNDIALGPLLVIAPALTAWFEGPRATAGVGMLAMAAQTLIGWESGALGSRRMLVPVAALAVLTALIVSLCVVRDRRTRQLAQVRSVAEAAQHVLLWPLPSRLGLMHLASVYLAAEEEAEIGGDLYAAARTHNSTRMMIGDVRGKGLPAIGEAALLLGAFREAARQHTTLCQLAAALERSVLRYLADFEPDEEAGERFATALLLEIPDDEPIAQVISCGHPAPLILGPGHAVTTPALNPAPPLGIGLTTPGDHNLDQVPFGPDNTLLLYTDGVIEARDHHGTFYPLAERSAQWTDKAPEILLHHIRRDLLSHTSGRLGDDAALVAVRRAPTKHVARPGRPTMRSLVHPDSEEE